MIEIFRTDVQNKRQAKLVLNALKSGFSEAHMNFDLNDCDKILRVEGMINTRDIVNNLNKLGFMCEVLN